MTNAIVALSLLSAQPFWHDDIRVDALLEELSRETGRSYVAVPALAGERVTVYGRRQHAHSLPGALARLLDAEWENAGEVRRLASRRDWTYDSEAVSRHFQERKRATVEALRALRPDGGSPGNTSTGPFAWILQAMSDAQTNRLLLGDVLVASTKGGVGEVRLSGKSEMYFPDAPAGKDVTLTVWIRGSEFKCAARIEGDKEPVRMDSHTVEFDVSPGTMLPERPAIGQDAGESMYRHFRASPDTPKDWLKSLRHASEFSGSSVLSDRPPVPGEASNLRDARSLEGWVIVRTKWYSRNRELWRGKTMLEERAKRAVLRDPEAYWAREIADPVPHSAFSSRVADGRLHLALDPQSHWFQLLQSLSRPQLRGFFSGGIRFASLPLAARCLVRAWVVGQAGPYDIQAATAALGWLDATNPTLTLATRTRDECLGLPPGGGTSSQAWPPRPGLLPDDCPAYRTLRTSATLLLNGESDRMNLDSLVWDEVIASGTFGEIRPSS